MCRAIIILLFVLFSFAGKGQQDTLLYFTFEPADSNSIIDNVSHKSFSVTSVKKNIELAPAAVGKGMRTDGYSTFINAVFSNDPKNELTAVGWFALETFPTDTAGLLTLKNKVVTEWVSAGINQFGFPVLICSGNNKVEYFVATTPVEKFLWFHVGLVWDKGAVQFFLNGKQILSTTVSFTGFNELVIGKDERKNFIAIFPLNFFNGIADEVTVMGRAFTEKDFSLIDYAGVLSKQADLTVPAIRFENDFNRPQYHLLPAANWTNETHGLIYYKGRYHIFNQKDGNNLLLRNINWGHFSSSDLLHWTEHRPAISPEPGYDQSGIWSGHCIIGPDNIPVIMYTGASSDTSFGMCLAFPEDDKLLKWKKFAGNPVVRGTPKQYARFDFRDPYLWKEKETWYMAVGFGIDEASTRRGALLLYKSGDLMQWQFLHTLYEGSPAYDSSGVFWEMPVFWKENDKYILLVNKVPYKGEPANALYWVGDFVNEKFVPASMIPRKLEVINQLLSPSVTKDKNGPTTAIAIIPDLIPTKAQYEQGWTHLYSIPRIWIVKGDKICQQPHPATKSLRGERKTFASQDISSDKSLVVSNGTQQVEIEMEIVPGNCRRFGFIIGKHPEGKELTKIIYDFDSEEFSVDKAKTSLNKNIRPDGRKGKYKLNRNKKVKIRLFIDGSVVEVFINNEDAFTTRIFPLLKESTGVELFSESGTIKLVSGNAWKLNGTNNKSDF